MTVQQWRQYPYPTSQPQRHTSFSPETSEPINWRAWLRGIEGKRRTSLRPDGAGSFLERGALARLTHASFQMDGIDLTDRDIAEALSRRGPARGLRSRQVQRVRNHAASLLRAVSLAAHGRPLTSATVVRWYASIGCGLCTAGPGEAARARLDEAIRQVNAPPAPLRAALEDIARLYWELLSEPFLPGFNGILARLILTYHLGRSGISPVVFDPARDLPHPTGPSALLRVLLERIEETYGISSEPSTAKAD